MNSIFSLLAAKVADVTEKLGDTNKRLNQTEGKLEQMTMKNEDLNLAIEVSLSTQALLPLHPASKSSSVYRVQCTFYLTWLLED